MDTAVADCQPVGLGILVTVVPLFAPRIDGACRPHPTLRRASNATAPGTVQGHVDDTVREDAEYWRAEALGGMELLRGRYRDRAFPRHAHETHVVSVIAEGCEELRLREAAFHVPTLGIVTLNPGIWHANHGRRGQTFALRSFYLDDRSLRELAAGSSDTKAAGVCFRHPVVTSEPRLALDLLRLHRRLEREPTGLAADEAVHDVFRTLLTRYGSVEAAAPRGDDRWMVARVKAHLMEHLAGEVRLHELASLVGRSAGHLLRAFRSATGVTPHQFQTQMRIRQAAALLRAGRPIGEAALDLGFTDQSHLTRHFTRSMGVPPGRFARRVKNVQDGPAPLAVRS